MDESSNLLIFWVVVVARFFLPLLIPRYPFPGILICLVVDGADYIIFQFFPPPLDNYQSFDKALDIHYLAIAYISTYRNWTDLFAFRVSRFLFFYRLVGVALFEVSQWRPLLLIFPNTFEYFFIFYETVRVWWNPQRLTKRNLLSTVAFIWIVIKLPQEYGIHIAQIDLPRILGEQWQTQPLLVVGAVALLVAVGAAVLWWLRGQWLRGHLPPPEHPPSFAADRYAEGFTDDEIRKASRKWAFRIFDRDLLEKVLLVALITIIFTQIIPGSETKALQIVVGVIVVTIGNTILSHWLARRGYGLPDTMIEFVVVGVVNLVVILAYYALLPGADNLTNTLFYILLLTLNVTLFDRFQQIYLMRFSERMKDEG